MSANTNYTIKLEHFEGPFDLLLFFIERDELDIYNIPITKITHEFLEYIQHMEQLNIELASEFILVAATLMRIKAKMLLPRKDIDAQGNTIDPRQELIDKILEYKRYKAASEELKLLEEERIQQLKRGNHIQEINQIGETMSEGTEIQSVTLYKLYAAYEKVMHKLNARLANPQHVVVKYNYTLETQRDYILAWTKREGNIPFEHLFAPCENRIHAIFNFLALLELIQQQFLQIVLGEGRNNFILQYNTSQN